MAQKEGVLRRALRAAFPHTIPIMAAFLFVGVTYGMLMRVAGFGFVYPMAMGAAIFGGTVEFVVAELLQGAFQPLQAFLLTLMLNARHLSVKGLGFSMTAMFIAIFLDHWRREEGHVSSVLGVVLTLVCLLVFGADGFLLPAFVRFLGRMLPGAVFGLLVVYCFKDVSLLTGSHGLPELIAGVIVVALHLWKKNMMLTVAGGTVVYMLLVNLVF